MSACYFTGHRHIYGAAARIYQELQEEIERHIMLYGVDVFYVGNYGDFDRMAQQALGKAKEKHPEIVAQVAVAYHPYLRPVKCPPGLDGTYFPEGQERVLPRYAIVKLNQRMVRDSSYLIAYVHAVTDGSKKLLEYAQRREKRGLLHITNLI